MSALDLDNSPNPQIPRTSQAAAPTEFHGYDRIFWLAYLSNGLMTMANASMVRYADFVNVVGGEERQLGLIVGFGMIGSIIIRLALGEAIDRCGAARVWLWSSLVYLVSLLLHLTVTTAYGVEIFLIRLMMQASLAGFSGSSITFVSLRVPLLRMAEMVGALGTSGFIGIMLGPLLGDWLASSGASRAIVVDRLFLIAAGLALCSTSVAWFVTGDSPPTVHRRRPNLWHVVTRYHPLVLSITAAAMGAGLSIPMTFLRPFAVEAHLENVGLFFVVYAGVGLVTRVATTSHFSRFGNRMWIISGLITMTISFLSYIPVTRTWHLIFPGAIAGVAHALLFPAVMSAGTAAFPRRYLGVATSLILATFDIGMLLGAPIVGAFIREAKHHTTAAYPITFAATAAAIGCVTILFCCSSAGRAK